MSVSSDAALHSQVRYRCKFGPMPMVSICCKIRSGMSISRAFKSGLNMVSSSHVSSLVLANRPNRRWMITSRIQIVSPCVSATPQVVFCMPRDRGTGKLYLDIV